MPTRRSTATSLLSEAELELYNLSRRHRIKHLDRRTLVAKANRARTLRDKNTVLYDRQRIETRDNSSSGVEKLRTRRKAELFDELMIRFDASIAMVDTRTARQSEPIRVKVKATDAKAKGKAAPVKAGARGAFSLEAGVKGGARAEDSVFKRPFPSPWHPENGTRRV